MRLYFYEGKNFGDALNLLILQKLFPVFFENDPSIDFFGIGSIIGDNLSKFKESIIYNSEFAYGTMPVFDSSFETSI